MSEESSYKIYCTDYIPKIGNIVLVTTANIKRSLKQRFEVAYYILISNQNCTLIKNAYNIALSEKDISNYTLPDGTILDFDFMHESALMQAKASIDENLNNKCYTTIPTLNEGDTKILWHLWFNKRCDRELETIRKECQVSELRNKLDIIMNYPQFG